MNRQLRVPVQKANEPSAFGASQTGLADTASYIADMSAELATLAGASGLPMLSYFLNLARVEAQICARDHGDCEPAPQPTTHR
ncbi:MAG TPA: hypothetical protein VEH76_11655 [Methylocystis sp.]|nr:hypothetical protein [Methylocystis sp.]